MNAYLALLKKEFLENRAGFLYAPAALTLIVFSFVVLTMMLGPRPDVDFNFAIVPSQTALDFMMLVVFGAWSIYLGIALFFYYSDSFNADRRNNGLLFWKSMPQSDFRILMSKAMAGLLLFPALILGFAAISGVLVYFVSIGATWVLPGFSAVSPIVALSSLIGTLVLGVLYFVMSVLWFAPFLAWVAGLSTLVGRWSIPLAFLVPGLIVLLERLLTFGQRGASRPIAEYLESRLEGLPPHEDYFARSFRDMSFSTGDMIGELFTTINYLDLATGLVFALGVIYLASEYRRRWITA